MKKAKILIVDDEEIILISSKKDLEMAGYRVKIARQGQEALDLVKQEYFDLVFLDLIMPGSLDSVQICKQIKSISPSTQVVLISGHPNAIEKMQKNFCLAGGRNEILRKPLLDEELSSVVSRVLRE